MEERKKFQSQTVDSKDYEKTEIKAKLIRDAGIVTPILFTAGIVLKKYGPEILKGFTKLRKPDL